MAAPQEVGLHTTVVAPALTLPPGASVKVQIIDSTSEIRCLVSLFMGPYILGHDLLIAPAFVFLVEQSSSGRKVLFDAGLRKDWENLPPAIQSIISTPGWKLDVQKGVGEILQENGVDVAAGAIEAVFWSHWHFDHIGDMSTFPGSTTLITGPGVKKAFLPAFPTNPKSPLLESDFTRREHKEIDFDSQATTKVGRFRAVDFFEDGSFYLVDAPGHAIGHIGALARVTSVQEGDSEDTFIFMGGDTAHHGGEFRPTAYRPLPKEITPSPYTDKYLRYCPGHVFEAIHPRERAVDPYYQPCDGVHHDTEQATRSCELMQDLDAVDNVFVVVAHDDTLLDPGIGIEWFPYGTMKNWKSKDYAGKVRWAFLKDFTPALEQ